MLKRVLTGGAIVIGTVLMLLSPVAAQRGARSPMFPTREQFAASSEAKKHVEAARTIARTDLLNDYALKMNAESILNAHPGIYQDTLADMETIRKNPNGANPLLYGRGRAARYWRMMTECATARVIALEEAGVSSLRQ